MSRLQCSISLLSAVVTILRMLAYMYSARHGEIKTAVKDWIKTFRVSEISAGYLRCVMRLIYSC